MPNSLLGNCCRLPGASNASAWYTSPIRPAMWLELNRSATSRRPAAPICARRAGSRNSAPRLAVSASTSPRSESKPVRSWSTTSTVPPSARATIGLPIAIASQNTSPNGSSVDGITNTSHAARSSSMRSRRPRNDTLAWRSSSATWSRSCAEYEPPVMSRPTISRWMSGNSARSRPTASMVPAGPFAGKSRQTLRRTGASSAIPRAARVGPPLMLGCQRATSIPFLTTWTRCGSMPPPVRVRPTKSETATSASAWRSDHRSSPPIQDGL